MLHYEYKGGSLMKAIRLRTEYLENPIGIDIRKPRFMWNCEGGTKQTAYQIITDKWDSGKVESPSMEAEYPLELSSREIVNWSVRLWDENDKAGESSDSSFEIGLLNEEDFKAKWITGNYSVNKKKRYPVDCFRTSFMVEKAVKKARLYITALGLYEAQLDGKKIGNFYMAPGYTDYKKRIQLQTYDVTEMLHTGQHNLNVELADGWFRGSCGAWGLKNQYGKETKLLAQLEIEYIGGDKECIISDDNWDWSNDGAIRFADNKDGEYVEAFRTPTYKGKAKETSYHIIPSASNNVPVTEHEHFKPVIKKAPSGKIILDFGQNIAGIISFKVNAEKGDNMTFKFGEMLDSDGNFTQENIQLKRKNIVTPKQKIDYICKDGLNEYKTKFAVFGFQYAEYEGDVEITSDDIEAIAVYSDIKKTAEFDCSNDLINKLVDATVWSAKGNHLDIPTDCPTRERHGWTGDAQIFFETAGILFDFAPFARKYLKDVFDWQKKSGRLPHITPEGGADFYMTTMNGSVGWSDVGILMPYRYWKLFGDREILKQYYDGMARYARFMENRIGKRMPIFAEHIRLTKENKKYLVNAGQSYGEWAEPEDVCSFVWTDFVAPHPEVSTAYTSYVLGIMSEIATELGYTEDAKEFKNASDGCKKAYQELVSHGNYTLDTDRQAQLVRGLFFDLLSDKQNEFAKKRLIKALENYDWRLGTGFLSTPLILFVLEDIDIEAAYRLLENEEIPGWLSMPKNGATTIWENWSGPYNTQGAGLGSLNHYSKGAVCEWLFKSMCGINIAGENEFLIAPKPGGTLTFAEAEYESVYGKVEVSWKRSPKDSTDYSYTITIPANCTAKVRLQGLEEKVLETGTYTF